jgi:Zn-dependent metalloprotease
MCKKTHRHSLFCILPPYVLKSIAQNGTEEQRRHALNALSVDTTIRSLRAERTLVPPPARAVITAQTLIEMEVKKERRIYTASNLEIFPGVLVRSENDLPSEDMTVNEAYDGLGDTFDFYWQIYQRNSIDDSGMIMDATVHFGQGEANAFWNGQQMIFGDGDGFLFNRFTASLDVIGHELAHGVTEDEAQLQYSFQSGALNESLSDVFGSLVRQYKRKQSADEADWLIGAELFTKEVKGDALRSMKAPGTAYDDPILGKDPQPAHMENFVNTFEDNGGVHINSGIPNRAFYLAATDIGGKAWEKAGRIWYETLRDNRLRPNSTFLQFARLTHSMAVRLYGNRSSEQKAVREAWQQVGIKVR